MAPPADPADPPKPNVRRIHKSKNTRIRKSKDPYIRKSKKPKIQKFKNPQSQKIQVGPRISWNFSDFCIFRIFGFFGFFDFRIFGFLDFTYIGFGGVGRISSRCHSKRGPYMLKGTQLTWNCIFDGGGVYRRRRLRYTCQLRSL